ncbi:hypothetical protein V8F33_004849 [Rhypophila sp. PSN 637]
MTQENETGSAGGSAAPAQTPNGTFATTAATATSAVGTWTIPSSAAAIAAPSARAASDSTTSSSAAPIAAATTTNAATAATNGSRDSTPVIMPRRPPTVALDRPPVGWPIPASERVADEAPAAEPVESPSDTIFVVSPARPLAAVRSALPRWNVPAAASFDEEEETSDEEEEEEEEDEKKDAEE